MGGGGGGDWRLLDVCVYNKIAEDKSFSIMIIVPDAVVSTSVRTTPSSIPNNLSHSIQ